MYADDIIIYGKTELKQAVDINKVLEEYCIVAGKPTPVAIIGERRSSKITKLATPKIQRRSHCVEESPTRYQMNGLRWLVSLYNNHLNGILAMKWVLAKLFGMSIENEKIGNL
ncbi:hypothetical protein IFM89_015378 [Coptis chinensis]|uniref:Reverse transcriptase domain-containing protein n=1 Tax=Coptis chinensis TaxID=261450 RepID=A0A835IA90_9MAGN|nr:hypothetical protein IFM89_015378 [Coptis chinensis]